MLSRFGAARSTLLPASACVLTAVLPVAAPQVCNEPTHLRSTPQALSKMIKMFKMNKLVVAIKAMPVARRSSTPSACAVSEMVSGLLSALPPPSVCSHCQHVQTCKDTSLSHCKHQVAGNGCHSAQA